MRTGPRIKQSAERPGPTIRPISITRPVSLSFVDRPAERGAKETKCTVISSFIKKWIASGLIRELLSRRVRKDDVVQVSPHPV